MILRNKAIIDKFIKHCAKEVDRECHITDSQAELDYIISSIDRWYDTDNNNYYHIDWLSLFNVLENHLLFLDDNGYEIEFNTLNKWIKVNKEQLEKS